MLFKDPMDVRVPATRVHQGLLTWSLSITRNAVVNSCVHMAGHLRLRLWPTQPSMRPVAQSLRSALLLSYC